MYPTHWWDGQPILHYQQEQEQEQQQHQQQTEEQQQECNKEQQTDDTTTATAPTSSSSTTTTMFPPSPPPSSSSPPPSSSSPPPSSSSSPPPLYTGWKWPINCCPYYRTAYKPNAQRFVQHHPIYRPLLQKCEESLSKSITNHQDHILPAFYETLQYLIQQNQQQQNQPFTIIFRTFGSDLEEMANVVSNFAQGKHPQYAHIQYPPLILPTTQLYQGRWKTKSTSTRTKHNVDNNNDDDDDDDTQQQGEELQYELWSYPNEDVLIASGDEEILQLLQSKTIVGIRDDYPHWKQHKYHPTAGKPIWVPLYTNNNSNNNNKINNNNDINSNKTASEPYYYPHHILFDDNIHNLPNDGIACVRQQQQQQQQQQQPKEQQSQQILSNSQETNCNHDVVYNTATDCTLYHGIHLIRVPTIEPVLNPKWFIQQIGSAQQKLQRQLQLQQQQQQQ
ncbi:hypothetical protein IV203_022679 [Nitzschia inconspicua]|nr:hypothetical protein IV203_022679 [Nitzschia inconspicua]